jgi:hypothetical protein
MMIQSMPPDHFQDDRSSYADGPCHCPHTGGGAGGEPVDDHPDDPSAAALHYSACLQPDQQQRPIHPSFHNDQGDDESDFYVGGMMMPDDDGGQQQQDDEYVIMLMEQQLEQYQEQYHQQHQISYMPNAILEEEGEEYENDAVDMDSGMNEQEQSSVTCKSSAALEVLHALAGLVSEPLSCLVHDVKSSSSSSSPVNGNDADERQVSCSPQSVMDVKHMHQLRSDDNDDQHGSKDAPLRRDDDTLVSSSYSQDAEHVACFSSGSLSTGASSSSPSLSPTAPPSGCSSSSSSSSSTSIQAKPITRKPSLKRVSSYNGGTTETSSSIRDEKTTSLQRRTVSFGHLELREYSLCLSDHPACSYGPPISLGWDFYQHPHVPTVEEYEMQRQNERCTAREEMILSHHARRFLLLQHAGYSKRELRRAVEEVERVKQQRLVTDFFLPLSAVDETLEQARHYIQKGRSFLFGGGQQ